MKFSFWRQRGCHFI